ncbi:MAG: hypothetical protein U5K00_15125 [Melioribacteraceae bacterium]|nr:hypothetical protein [Melioribacteraceae bacterium]
MTLIGFLLLLLIAAICGAIGQSIAGYNLGGCIISMVVGFIGAWLGLWIAEEFRLPLFWTVYIGGKSFPIVWSVIGATLFSLIIGFVGRAMQDD